MKRNSRAPSAVMSGMTPDSSAQKSRSISIRTERKEALLQRLRLESPENHLKLPKIRSNRGQHRPTLRNLIFCGREGQRDLERMVFSIEDAQSGERRALRSKGLPSPALCCACGLCIMLAGINITLVGALAFTKLLPLNNPPIIIGPILLLVAFSFFGACCTCSQRPIRQGSHMSAGRDHWPLMRMGRAVFEMETSEPTLQDTTAIQLSPTNSTSSSPHCSPIHLPVPALLHS